MEPKTTTDQILDALADYIADPSGAEQEDGSYRVSWPTEYDDAGELREDPVEDLRAQLPGCRIEWTGEGSSDREDFIVSLE